MPAAILVFAIFFLPSPAGASAAPGCKISTDCAVIEGACPGTWEATLVQNQDDREQAIEDAKSTAQCTPRPGGRAKAPTALCQEGRCRLIRLSVIDTRDIPGPPKKVSHHKAKAIPVSAQDSVLMQ